MKRANMAHINKGIVNTIIIKTNTVARTVYSIGHPSTKEDGDAATASFEPVEQASEMKLTPAIQCAWASIVQRCIAVLGDVQFSRSSLMEHNSGIRFVERIYMAFLPISNKSHVAFSYSAGAPCCFPGLNCPPSNMFVYRSPP